MRTIVLMAAMLLTLTFARPIAAQEVEVKLFSGYLVGNESYQFGADRLIIEGSGNGNSTLGKFTITYHIEVDYATGRGRERDRLIFANGDVWNSTGVGINIGTGVGAVGQINEIHIIKKATGQFAGQPGDFKIERFVDTATGAWTGSLHGEFDVATGGSSGLAPSGWFNGNVTRAAP